MPSRNIFSKFREEGVNTEINLIYLHLGFSHKNLAVRTFLWLKSTFISMLSQVGKMRSLLTTILSVWAWNLPILTIILMCLKGINGQS